MMHFRFQMSQCLRPTATISLRLYRFIARRKQEHCCCKKVITTKKSVTVSSENRLWLTQFPLPCLYHDLELLVLPPDLPLRLQLTFPTFLAGMHRCPNWYTHTIRTTSPYTAPGIRSTHRCRCGTIPTEGNTGTQKNRRSCIHFVQGCGKCWTVKDTRNCSNIPPDAMKMCLVISPRYGDRDQSKPCLVDDHVPLVAGLFIELLFFHPAHQD
ncbi:hypothetical protein BDP27DRAFT_1328197 [Rhodocollybia butyracea]|uniref:Uncharacterized protein n=1 Tax=Rhodocollybia butyracea TaxID=206335 RepID=A0A9P5PLH2_9AGAR|nr:hypothetical protein BDP27DRAFT_1328197 [Rhodocollybia butyracea]